jgi:hypothetical protein
MVFVAHIPPPSPPPPPSIQFKLLTKKPDCKTIAEGDTFGFNKDFKSKMNKFCVPVATVEPTHDMKRVREDQSFAMDAFVVRIMKARKQLQHNILLAEVLCRNTSAQPFCVLLSATFSSAYANLAFFSCPSLSISIWMTISHLSL